MLLDSNIVIYALLPEHGSLLQLIAEHSPSVSAVSYVEVLGYHGLTAGEKAAFEKFFAAARVLPIGSDVLLRAAQLRQSRKMTLGDALIAATALEFGLRLVTRNTRDYRWIEGLELQDPLAE
jgi:predicted nucleic acid-binding protein